ncbi:hypothetical protein C0989_004482, partial [Termitomyces sp. Mn162]
NPKSWLKKAKEKAIVSLEKQQAFFLAARGMQQLLGREQLQGLLVPNWGPALLSLQQYKEGVLVQWQVIEKHWQEDGMVVEGSGVTKGRWQEKSYEVVESEDKDDSKASNNGSNNNNVLLACKQLASATLVAMTKQQKMVASKEREEEQEDVEMRKMTLLATVAEVEPVVSRGEIEDEGEAIEVEKDEESKDEDRVQQWGAWSSMPLQQVSNNKLEWLEENLALPTPLILVMLL